MRSILITVLLGFIPALVGCGAGPIPEGGPSLGQAKLVFKNRTDSVMCYGSDSAYAASHSYCGKVKANGRSVWRPECDSAAGLRDDYVKGGFVGVVLGLGETGRQLYSGSARCDEETEFLIEHNGEEFVVTKNVTKPLPGQPPGP